MVKITDNISQELQAFLSENQYDKVFVLTDENTVNVCLPNVKNILDIHHATYLTPVAAGDTNKNINNLINVWTELKDGGASRNSLLINLGGGMITDMGGFAGATFKRGIRNLNIPTSLMASVDAAVGGKTGINFCGLKNEIGSFYEPDCVMIDCSFLTTLDHKNFLSGYAEMLKHGLISKKETFDELMSYDIDKQDVKQLNVLVGKSVAVKERIVAEDPREHGIRKALNFGHTVGHAVESLSFAREEPLLHGLAVAVGIVAELFLSYKVCGFPLDILRLTTNFIIKNYPRFIIGCNDFESLLTLMTHDKKNHGGQINFTLLGNIGDIRINQQVSDALIEEALDFYREN